MMSIQITKFLQKSRTSKTWFMVKVLPFDGLLLFFESLEIQKFYNFEKPFYIFNGL